MIQVILKNAHIEQHAADLYVMMTPQGHVITDEVKRISQQFYPALTQVIETRKFTGSAGSQLVVAGLDGQRPVTLMLVGLGSEKLNAVDRLEQVRRAMGQVIRAAEQVKAKTISLLVPDHDRLNVTPDVLAKELVSIAMMTAYHFDQFITDEHARFNQDYTINLCAPELLHDQLSVGVEFGQRIGHAVNQARQWCDLPGSILTPPVLAGHAERIAKVHNLKATIFDEPTIIKMGMGGLAAVSAGSAHECRFVALEYKTEHPHAKTIVLTGKGITFDSGGISIKPANRMEEMKDDMAGAAAVISTMEALAHLKPRVNVIGITPIAENMPSGTATRPGDIIKFYNGKTAEVKNTDAEGRLILADALSYAVKHYQPDAIINVATLTGSCAAALGPFFAGMMSKSDDLVCELKAASERSGDRLWRLPFHDDYKKAVRSTVADICNIGNDNYRAGAITAGFFLEHFVDKTPWVHLDIAGTSFNVPDMSYYRPGATGFGVRLFIDYLMNIE